MPPKEETHMRGTVISVVIGLAACALGGMLSAASSSASDNRQLLASCGMFLLVIGGLMFGIAVLVELFSIRPALAKHEALSLLLESRAASHRPPEMPPAQPPAGEKRAA